MPVYNIPGVSAELKFTGPVLADIFLGKITKWNDPAIAKLNPGVNLPATDITVVAPVGRVGHDLHLGRLPVEGVAGVEEQGRRRHVGELAGRRRRQRQRRRRRPRQADARRDRLRRADLRAAEQDQLRRGAERGRQVREGVDRVGDRGRGRGGDEDARRLPRVDHQRARATRSYPISSFTWLLLYESPKDKAQGKVMVDFMKWALTDGQKFAPRARLRAAAEERRRHGDAGAREDQGAAVEAGRHRWQLRQRTRPDDLCFRVGTGAFALVLDRRSSSAIGVELLAPVAAVDPEVRLAVLADRHLGSGRRRVRRAAVHLGHALFVGAGAAHLDARSRSASRSSSRSSRPAWLRRPLVFLTELLAAIPSIVYGLWGIFVLVPLVRQLEIEHARRGCKAVPLFSGPPLGVGMLSAALILAIMVIPFTSSVAREVLRAVPQAQREGAYALGATRWEAIRMALFYARTGIIGAIMLGFGRALGETMAVTMVIGNNPQITTSLFAPQYTMAAVIANEFTEATDDIYLHALVEIGLVLFVITLIINVLSRLLIWSHEPAEAADDGPARRGCREAA